MGARRITTRSRITKQIGRDPAEVIYEQVYLRNRTLAEAGRQFGVHATTAMHWLRDYERTLILEQIAAESVAV